jgi:hypothetical protein
MDASETDPESHLNDLELRLGRWQPTSGGLSRDRLIFEAGRAAARAEAWTKLPLLTTAVLALVAAGLGTMLVRERGERHALVAQIARLSTPPNRVAPTIEATSSEVVIRTPAPESYLALTHHRPADDLDGISFERTVVPRQDGSPRSEPTLRVRGLGGPQKF